MYTLTTPCKFLNVAWHNLTYVKGSLLGNKIKITGEKRSWFPNDRIVILRDRLIGILGILQFYLIFNLMS